MSEALQDLKKVMELLGIEPKRSLGQNFLVSDHVINKIIEATRAQNPKSLIEIGPGLGALTRHLKSSNYSYELIELDKKFVQFWRDQGLVVTEGDALRIEWQDKIKNEETVLVSNLPYQISSSIVIDRSLDKLQLKAMVLMFQKEVAQRIRAQKQTENYGLLSVIAQSFWKIEFLLEAGARDFLPPPRVASRVLVFNRISSPVENKKAYLGFIKLAFSQRRKLLVKNLRGLSIEGMSSENLEDKIFQWLSQNKQKETARAEELSVDQFVQLFKFLGLDKV